MVMADQQQFDILVWQVRMLTEVVHSLGPPFGLFDGGVGAGGRVTLDDEVALGSAEEDSPHFFLGGFHGVYLCCDSGLSGLFQTACRIDYANPYIYKTEKEIIRMPRRPNTTHSTAKPSSDDEKPSSSEVENRRPKRSAFLWLALFVLLLNGSWAVHHFQFENLPLPLTAEKAGKRGFSEVSAMEHVQNLTKLGPHPVGSDALDLALQGIYAFALVHMDAAI
ncbi:hypothetical protein COCNU_10G009560 [Cocos nucifera]|uniref:Uncharacterized protein n=1 Tax=Cocos nucifera TaxID=13894 RepID=A0A8K0INC1_COCNU|nr:hypothetical protein COCNU_10G009560 [Cocos nucifera]